MRYFFNYPTFNYPTFNLSSLASAYSAHRGLHYELAKPNSEPEVRPVEQLSTTNAAKYALFASMQIECLEYDNDKNKLTLRLKRRAHASELVKTKEVVFSSQDTASLINVLSGKGIEGSLQDIKTQLEDSRGGFFPEFNQAGAVFKLLGISANHTGRYIDEFTERTILALDHKRQMAALPKLSPEDILNKYFHMIRDYSIHGDVLRIEFNQNIQSGVIADLGRQDKPLALSIAPIEESRIQEILHLLIVHGCQVKYLNIAHSDVTDKSASALNLLLQQSPLEKLLLATDKDNPACLTAKGGQLLMEGIYNSDSIVDCYIENHQLTPEQKRIISLQTAVNELRNERDHLKATQERLRQELQGVATKNTQSKVVASLQTCIAELSTENDELKKSIQTLQDNQAAITSENATLKETVLNQQKALTKLLEANQQVTKITNRYNGLLKLYDRTRIKSVEPVNERKRSLSLGARPK